MLPSPERIRNSKIFSAIAAVGLGITAAALSLFLATSTPARAALLLEQRFSTASSRRACCVLRVDELDYVMNRKQDVIYNLFDWPGRRYARYL